MTVPVTGVVPGPVTVKVAAVNVRESIPSLNVAVIFPLVGTAVAAFAGTVELTVGAVVSTVVHDWKLHEKLLRQWIARRVRGRGGDRGGVYNIEAKIARWRKDRDVVYCIVGYRSRYRSYACHQKGRCSDRQRVHRLGEGYGDFPVDGLTDQKIGRIRGADLRRNSGHRERLVIVRENNGRACR